MPGPIETAFVDIVATLRFDQNTQLSEGIRREVSKAQKEFDKLENIGAEAARSISTKFSSIKVDLNVRDAVNSVKRLGNAVEAATGDLRALTGKSVDLNTAAFKRNIDNLERSFVRLEEQFKLVDGQTLTINVATAEVRIKEVLVNVQKLLNDLNAAARKNINLDVAPAIAALRLVGERATAALAKVRAIGENTVSVKVSDLGLDELESKLRAAAAEIEAVSGKRIVVDTRPAVEQVNTLEARAAHVGDTFERVGKRLLAFAVFGGITAGISQLVRSGIQAAAAIEVVQVSIDRLFKGFAESGKQLGGTATAFFDALRQLALRTPFQVTDLGNVATRVLQIDTNMNKVVDSTGKLSSRADIAINRLRAVADAGAEIGATSQDLNGVVNAIQKIGARSTVTLLGLNQISQRLPNFGRTLQIESIIEQLNKVRPGLNATVADFDKLRKDGLIPVTTAVDGLFEGLKKIPGAAGAAAAQAATLQGVLSNLKDFATIEFSKAFASVGQLISKELNAAFAQTTGQTALSKAVSDVIAAAGIATQKALPAVLAFITSIASKVADAVSAIGALIQSVAGGFGGNLFAGALTGLTDVINLLTIANDLLSHLPKAVGESIGQFVVLSTVLSQLTGNKVNVLSLVIDQLKNIVVAAGQVIVALFGVQTAAVAIPVTEMTGFEIATVGATVATEGLRAALASLATATVILAAITAAFLVIQNVLGNNAKAARWSKEFQESINAATTSLKNFSDVTSAAQDFVKQFADQTNKIKLGDLSDILTGQTTTELATNLGITQEKLAELVSVVAEFGPNSAQANAEMAKLGITTGTLKNSLGELGAAATGANLNALADQFAKAAPAAFDAAVAQRTFNFVTDDTTKAIAAATKISGDYLLGLKQLHDANEVGAQAEFKTVAAINNVSTARQRALLKDATTTDAAGHSTIDYTKALGNLRQQIVDLDAAFLDILDNAPNVGIAFRGLTADTDSARAKMLRFAAAVDEAGLSATDLDALAQQLGTSLTGGELSKALAKISTDFKDTLATLTTSVPQFSDAVTTAFGSIKVDAALTGIDAVQSAFDQFSISKFIVELNKVASAKINLVSNLNELADKSTEAVRRLFELKLDPTQLAITAKALNEGGQKVIDAFVAPFQISDALLKTTGSDLVNKLVQAGIDPALLAAIPGLTDSVSGAIGTALSNVQPELDKLQALKLTVDPKLRGEITQDIADLKSAQSELAGQVSKTAIDTAAAVKSATDAGTQVANAFNTTVSSGLTETIQTTINTLATDFASLGNTLSVVALAIGTNIGTNLVSGFTGTVGDLMARIQLPEPDPNDANSARAQLIGLTLGAAFIDGLSFQLDNTLGTAFGQPLQKILDGLPAVNDLFNAAGVAISDALVTGMGENIDDGFHQAIVGSLAQLLIDLNTQTVSFKGVGTSLTGALVEGLGENIGDGLDELVLRPITRLLENLGNQAIFFSGVGAELGSRLMQGLQQAIDGREVANDLDIILQLLGQLTAPAYDSGFKIGQSLGQGLIAGLDAELAAARAAGAGLVDSAEQGAREHSKAHSPSLLFAELGKDLGDGLTQGIVRSTAGAVTAMTSSVSALADVVSGGVGTDTLAASITDVFNVLIARVNDAFKLLAGKLGVSQVFAGDPVKRFASGLVATQAITGTFGEHGAEALIPLTDGAAAGRIISQLAPFLGSAGRAALADVAGTSGQTPPAGPTHTHDHTWNVTVPTDDPESFARRAAIRLERRIQR